MPNKCPLCNELIYKNSHTPALWFHYSTDDEFCKREYLIEQNQSLQIQADLCAVYKQQNNELYLRAQELCERIRDLESKVDLRNAIILETYNDQNNR